MLEHFQVDVLKKVNQISTCAWVNRKREQDENCFFSEEGMGWWIKRKNIAWIINYCKNFRSVASKNLLGEKNLL